MCNGDTEWQFKGCPSLRQRKIYFINKAISTGDLISIDGTIIRPISLEDGELSYMDMTELNEYVVDIGDLEKVEEYE